MDEAKLKITEEMQQVVEQMKLDDLEEDPSLAEQYFDCDCCGKTQPLAGSVLYENTYRLCNDCVLYAETGFALKQISNIQELMDAMEDKRLEEICEFIKQDQKQLRN